jgi:hypothetical protein
VNRAGRRTVMCMILIATSLDRSPAFSHPSAPARGLPVRRPSRDGPKVRAGGKTAHAPRQRPRRRLRSISLGPRINRTKRPTQINAAIVIMSASSIGLLGSRLLRRRQAGLHARFRLRLRDAGLCRFARRCRLFVALGRSVRLSHHRFVLSLKRPARLEGKGAGRRGFGGSSKTRGQHSGGDVAG